MGEAIFAIDPGTTQSAWLLLRDGKPEGFGIEDNHAVLMQCYGLDDYTPCAVEKVASYGMAVGEEVFQTVFWSGRFYEAINFGSVHRILRPTRKEVVVHLCGSAKATDANVRQALIDRFGGSDAIRKGGALYKVSKDVWAALAVAMWAHDHTPEVNP